MKRQVKNNVYWIGKIDWELEDTELIKKAMPKIYLITCMVMVNPN